MGLYDDIDKEVLKTSDVNASNNNNTKNTGLFEDIDNEVLAQKPQTFKETHPFVASLPEAGKQLGLRAVKSYPEFAKGVNDLAALVGDKTNIQGLSNFGRNNAEFWQDTADKIVIDDKYRGLNGLKNKETLIPTIAGEVGGQFTNLLMAAGGGAAAGTAAKAASLGKTGTGIAALAGTAVPNLAQEGQYLEKIEEFKNIYGRIPTVEELKYIQNVALGEKGVNTALETISDRLLFAKLFPQRAAAKGVKGILKNAGEQAITEAGTEGMQESVSIGAEKMPGLNNDSLGESLGRIGEASALGGIMGGVIGGSSNLVSQPYDSQFKNAPVEAIQNVSAKIADGGKVLYDSAGDKVNTAVNEIANMANSFNAPDTFDILTKLRKDGVLSPSKIATEKIAPNIANKKAIKEAKPKTKDILEKPKTKAEKKEAAKEQAIEKIKKMAPNIAAKKEAVENISNNNLAKNQNLVEKIAGMGFDKETVNEHIRKLENAESLGQDSILHTMQARLYEAREKGSDDTYNELNTLYNEYKTKRKQQFSAENQVSSKIKEIAPNIAAKVEAKRESKIVKSHGIVTGLDENGRTAKYEYGIDKNGNFEVEKIEKQTDNHTDKKDSITSFANDKIDNSNEVKKLAKDYANMLGHNEVREFHESFANALVNKDAATIKNLVAYGRGFNENSKKMFSKYTGIKLPSTIKGKKEVIDKWAKGEETKEVIFNNNNKTLKIKEKDLLNENGAKTHYISDNYLSNGSIAYKRNYFNIENKETDFHYYRKDDGTDNSRNFDNSLDSLFEELESNKNILKNPKLTKHRRDSLIMLENGNTEVFINKKYYDSIKDFDLYAAENESLGNILVKNQSGESVAVLAPMKLSGKDLETAKNIAKPIKYKKNEKVYSSRKINKGDNNNGNELAGNGVSEKLVENGTQNKENATAETKQTDKRNSDTDRRKDELSDKTRGISKKHAELINKDYKNQHELNLAIEKFINDEEYKMYSPGSRFPQAIKDWLKKYTGAGGLEKQGAQGKGLLSEYYTPKNIVDKMWELTAQYIDVKNAKVLEPSVGIGRFLENAEAKIFDIVEMNPVSAKITKILYPDVNVTIGEFQEKFIDKANNTPVKSVRPEYDIVIGNPPYGIYSGRYKGLGEGKKFSRLEAYFINRGLDLLKENGIMTFIVPSSFLDGAITLGKQEIGKKCELLDAYRLSENTFDTTSIGTDIIVLRKTNGKTVEQNINLDRWFKNNPDKILGTIETRKNRFGKEETYVKGDKNAVDKISAVKKDIKETIDTVIKTKPETEQKQNIKIEKNTKKTAPKAIKGEIEYREYVPENKASEREIELWEHTAVDGTIQGGGYTIENGKQVRYFRPGEDINQYRGELYNDFNYLQGDIYEKLDELEKEDISKKQKDIQRKKLKSVLPEPKAIVDISFNPTSDFIREFETGIVQETEKWDYSTRTTHKVFENKSLDELYLKYVNNLSRSERGDMTTSHIYDFVKGNKIRIDYRYPSGCYGDKERAEFRKQKSAEVLSKLKNIVDKTFNDFVRNELTREQQEKLANEWNRRFNAVYNPDYTKMPMMVKGLNSEFYGKKLELQNVQIEGVNFLTNKGVGLLGFEVGVGKTLTGIISTVQNMQMGRCRKPLILVPKQVKDNWIREINQAFPNIKVNDVDNMSKFKGEIAENTLTVATYEALGNIWYEDSIESLTNKIYNVQNNFSRESTKRGQEITKETAEKMLGEAEKGNKKLFTVQELGFDHITVDEAHNFKNLFDKAKAAGQDGNTYANITGGSQSTRAARLFLMAQYILNNNHNRNVFMLTATPFNNSPIEVFNMVSFIGKDKLDKMGLYNVYQFMENYADISSDWIVNSKNEVEYKQIVTGFKNASSLRELIKSIMLIRSAEDAGIVRPEKHTKRVILEPSEAQIELIKQAEEEATTGKKDDGAILKAINQSRQATLSPDIATNNFDVTPEDFVKNSPKIHYVMEALEAMKKKDGLTSQIIYMPQGVKFLPKMKEYLVNKGVFKADEVAIIDSNVTDDKISKITDSFNDKNGKIKLVIGTNKIKEGMNLNKNSSVLYVPYMDWNPTDFVQVVGRIWRRGNRYSKIRVVVPLLKNSSDSFMFQKLSEKTERINNIMDESKEYIDTSELNTAEEKINMISNPDKKVKMFIRVEEQKLQGRKSSLEGRLEMVQSYKNQLSSDENMVKYYEKNIEETQKDLDEIEEQTGWRYDTLKGRLDGHKKDLQSAKASLRRTKARIEKLELDFEGKDSTEAIEAEIEKVQSQIKDVKNLGEKKLIEYQKAYEEERKNKKTIEELIAEFDRDTDSLYGNNESVEDYEEFDLDNTINGAVQLYDVLKTKFRGEKIGSLCADNEFFKLFKDELESICDYTIDEMPESFMRPNLRGVHLGKQKIIYLNMKAIGDDVEKLARTLLHEAQHAKQENEYRKVLNKKYKTDEDWEIIGRYKECKKVNKDKADFYYKHKDVLNKIHNDLKDLSKEQRKKYLNKLEHINTAQYYIYKKYDILYKAYKNAQNEINARKAGDNGARKARNEFGRRRKGQSVFSIRRGVGRRYNDDGNGLRQFSDLGNGTKTREEYKEALEESEDEPIGLSRYQKAALTKKRNIKNAKNILQAKTANEEVKEYIRRWRADIEKDRYDVNRVLNSFINITNSLAKEYTKTLRFDVSGKQIREIMPFLRERSEFPEKLERPELKNLFDNLDKSQKTRLTNLADKLSENMQIYYKNYKDSKGIIDENEIENHISHIWDLDKKQKSLLTNHFALKSRFAKQRTISTLLEGINGIERDGEIVYFKPKVLDYAEILKLQTDSFIKAASDTKLANAVKNIKDGKTPLVLPIGQAPYDWVEINNPALSKSVFLNKNDKDIITMSKTPVKVHPDIAASLKTVFENKREYLDILGFKPGEILDKTNAVAKQFNFSLSGFHGWALSESFLGNVGIKNGVKEVFNFKKIFESVKNNDYDIYKKDEIAKQAIDDGLQIGATLDTQRDAAEGLIENTSKYLEKNIPGIGKIFSLPVEITAKTTKINNKILWDCIHNNYKIGAYEILVSNEMNKKGSITQAQRREIAQWVNDSFGGQVWENLGINPSTKKAASRWLMSPDWLLSTTRQFMGMFSSESLHRNLNKKAEKSDIWQKVKDITTLLGINSITDDVGASGVRGRMARTFWIRSVVIAAIYMNVLNAVLRAWDRDKNKELYPDNMKPVDYTMLANSTGSKQYIFIGRNKDGTERYLRLGKQFREIPEMIADPIKHIGAKTAPIAQAVVTGFTGRAMGGFENKEISKAKGWARIGLAAKNLGKSYLPFSVSSAMVKRGDYSLFDLIGSTSRGMTKYKAKEEYIKAWNRTKLPQKAADVLRMNEEEIARSMQMNRISQKDINSVRKSARTTFVKPYKEEYKKALVNGDSGKIIKITEKMEQNKISSLEQRKIYLKALSEFYKERGIAQ